MSISGMRTYRPHHSSAPPLLISRAAERCRLCLSHSGTLSPIFESTNSITLTTRIFTCLSFQVVQNEHLPVNICNQCLSELNRYYEFRKKCQMNNEKLRKHLKIAEHQDKLNTTPIIENCPETTIEDESIKPSDLILTSSGSKKDENEDLTTNGCKSSSTSKEDIGMRVGALIRAALVWSGSALTVSADGVTLAPGAIAHSLQLHTRDAGILTLQLEEEQPDGDPAPVVSPPSKTPPPLVTGLADGAASCGYCPDLTFTDINMLAVHMESHKPIKGEACEYCGKWFDVSSALRRHRRTHTGERPYSCDTCARRFAQKEVLQRHLLVHLEKRPFACEVCEKSFTQREALKAHSSSHLPPASRALRLRACSLCPKAFCHRSGLTRHMKSHTGQHFVCTPCGRSFSDQSSLRRHSLVQHLKCYEEIPCKLDKIDVSE